ncbi:MAG: SHOCT domain-containing protein, partial [Clostridia bacterium]|nr:SHOCT domain-containing protein [Clostridia bacterium]
TDDVKNKDFYEDIDLKEYLNHIAGKNFTISEDEMDEGVKRHISVILYDTLKKTVKRRKILSVVYPCSCSSNNVINVVTRDYCFGLRLLYENKIVEKSEFTDIRKMKFETRSHGYRWYFGNISWPNAFYSCQQTDAISQYIDEIIAEDEKEKAIEADIQKQVEKLVKLKTIGLITDEEFEEKRKALLERMGI